MSARISARNPSPVAKRITFTADRIPEGGPGSRIRTRTANARANLVRTVTLNLGNAPAVATPTRFRYVGTVTFGLTSVAVDFEVLVNP
jgi:hypothetical protein